MTQRGKLRSGEHLRASFRASHPPVVSGGGLWAEHCVVLWRHVPTACPLTAAGSSTTTVTPTRSVGRSGSFLKKLKRSPGVVSLDSTTTGDSASIASSLHVSPQGKYLLRNPSRSSSSIALPSLAGSFSSEVGTGSSSEEGVGKEAYAGVKRSPPAPVTVHKRSPPAPVTVYKRSPPAPVTVHNIPHKCVYCSTCNVHTHLYVVECVHACVCVRVCVCVCARVCVCSRFSSQLALLHSAKVKCSFCKASLQRGSRYSKCTCEFHPTPSQHIHTSLPHPHYLTLHPHILNLGQTPLLTPARPDCKNMYHMKCAKLAPSNCGLPPSLAEYTDDTPPPKRIKGDKVMSSSSDEGDKPSTFSLQQGWVNVYR